MMNSRMAMFTLVVTVMCASGCISPMLLADRAGYLAGTGYLVVNTPPADEVKAVKKVLGDIQEFTGSLKEKETFASLYGPISKRVVNEFQGTKRILALSITRILLDGLDTFMLANPEWADDKKLAVQLAKAFINGADKSFDAFATNPAIKANILRVKKASAKAYGTVRIRSP